MRILSDSSCDHILYKSVISKVQKNLLSLRWVSEVYSSKRWTRSTPLIIVVERQCLSNNGQIKPSTKCDISVVELWIVEMIDRSDILS
jgi:hypothetical protein